MRYLSISLVIIFLYSCALTRAASFNLLDQRADYSGENRLNDGLSELSGPLLTPRRTESKTADIFIHPHEMPSGDYFLGGWIRTIVSPSRWELEKNPEFTIEPQKNTNKGKPKL